MTEIPKPEFNFPEHIKFKFDWNTYAISRTKLEEDLFVEYNTNKSLGYVFSNAEEEYYNPYGPAILYMDGSYFHYTLGMLHNLDGYSMVNVFYDGSFSTGYSVSGVPYNTDLEYWIAVEKYKKEHGLT